MEDKKKRNQYAYDKRAYDHIHLQVPKGAKEALQAHAKGKGYNSLNAYTRALYEADGGLDISMNMEE